MNLIAWALYTLSVPFFSSRNEFSQFSWEKYGPEILEHVVGEFGPYPEVIQSI